VKVTIRVLVRLVCVVVSLMGVSAVSAASLVHMVCRGGGQMELRAHTIDVAAGTIDTWFIFQAYAGPKSSVQTDGSHLAPGECSWSAGIITQGNVVTYSTTADQVALSITLKAPYMQTGTYEGAFWRLDSATDLNLRWVPLMLTAENSLLDPNAILHFNVLVDGRSLRLSRMR
jgi:hypothetical protein